MQNSDYKTHLLPQRGASSRRGRRDAKIPLHPDDSLNKLRDSLVDLENKYKRALMSIAKLDKEKGNLMYQVDNLKDIIEEMEEQMAEYNRENEDKSKRFQSLQTKLDEGIRCRDELLLKHGIVPEDTPRSDITQEMMTGVMPLMSQETGSQSFQPAGDGELGKMF